MRGRSSKPGRASRRWAETHPSSRTKKFRNWWPSANAGLREDAPTSAAEAATIILDGVKADRWRILVGPDAHIIDEMVRASPERAYDTDFFEEFAKKAGWRLPT